MADYTKLDGLVSGALAEMRRPKYSENAITGFRRMFAAFTRHASSCGHDEFSEVLAVGFVNWKFEVDMKQLYQANPGGCYLKAWLRAMRILLEFQECDCICKRMPGELKRTALPSDLQSLLDSFNSMSRRNGHSESTICSRNGRIKRFLLFLADKGGKDASCITESSAHDYILTKSSNHAKSARAILTAIRCFYRHLHLEGIVDRDLTGTVPSPKLYYSPELPAAWSKGDAESLMDSIDRGNPTGKRDHAMLLMVARLGLRASDIKSVRAPDFDWEARTLSIVQRKTRVPLELPLLDDVGRAVIDCLRGGRPEGAICPELFVRQVAPSDPFTGTSNLTYILVKRARAAGVSARGGRALHSLRHALAARLLGRRVPIEDISRILGRVNKRTTSIYLRMDVDMLSKCALGPEAVAL